MSGFVGRWVLAACCAAGIGLLAPTRAAAGFQFRVDTTGVPVLNPGDTANLDVYLDIDPNTPAVAVGGFTVRLNLAAGSGLLFTGAADPTGAGNYIFAGNSFGYVVTALDPNLPTTFDAPGIALSDAPDSPATITLPVSSATESYLLGTVGVRYSGSPSGGTIAVAFDRDITGLNDATGEPVPGLTYEYVDGTLVTAPSDATATPLPPAVVAFAAGGLLLAGVARRRRP